MNSNLPNEIKPDDIKEDIHELKKRLYDVEQQLSQSRNASRKIMKIVLTFVAIILGIFLLLTIVGVIQFIRGGS
ncbi:hypothetical protein HMSSN036_25080 [Paenibacillus macerans]|uniref:hypothetical protein n=1 Tax=Paenibacillus TaxID=44249 RepID=UPI00097AF2FA|nr:hypothetical protein [Paenibacillus macerans]OMG50245.1 hypothetical protein BK140_06825 [Paenibacillus macerans]GBK62294.1 hypothetical protein PbDSM24746_22980 [Paenibacillus macerans]GBK68606.1 hypothetical protein PbJCM17693_23140 [Paenibacillus macerans]GJM70292.1 hypothetical protein HMSSN036_25080 [Paenibacillus macerans]